MSNTMRCECESFFRLRLFEASHKVCKCGVVPWHFFTACFRVIRLWLRKQTELWPPCLDNVRLFVECWSVCALLTLSQHDSPRMFHAEWECRVYVYLKKRFKKTCVCILNCIPHNPATHAIGFRRSSLQHPATQMSNISKYQSNKMPVGPLGRCQLSCTTCGWDLARNILAAYTQRTGEASWALGTTSSKGVFLLPRFHEESSASFQSRFSFSLIWFPNGTKIHRVHSVLLQCLPKLWRA